MMKRLLGVTAGCALLLLGAGADAASLGLSPGFQSVPVGGAVDVEVVISGLGDGAAPTLAGFDLDIAFDPGALSFSSVEFGADLGIVGVETILDVNLLAGPARVDLANSSLLSNAVLDANQPAAFVLATLHFTALSIGTSALAITQAVLANASGGAIPANLAGASVDVVVPEPASLALLALGLAGLSRARARVG